MLSQTLQFSFVRMDGKTAIYGRYTSMKAEDIQLSHKIRSSVAIALIGEVVPSLRAIAIDWSDYQIRTVSYYEGAPTEDDFYLAEIIKSELKEDFGEDWVIVTDVVRRDAPAKMEPLRSWAFYRKEL